MAITAMLPGGCQKKSDNKKELISQFSDKVQNKQ
jgi:hypothetical protein